MRCWRGRASAVRWPSPAASATCCTSATRCALYPYPHQVSLTRSLYIPSWTWQHSCIIFLVPCQCCSPGHFSLRLGSRCSNVKAARATLQARPLIFDLQIRVPDVLYEEVVEVDEEVLLPLGTEPDRCTSDAKGTSKRITAALIRRPANTMIKTVRLQAACNAHERSPATSASGNANRAGGMMMQVVCRRSGQHPREDEQAYAPEGERRETVTGEMVCVRRKVDLDALRADLQASTLSMQW